MDEIFHEVSGWRGAFTVVKVANQKPRRYGKNGELLIAYDDTVEAQEVQRRKSSVVSATAGEKSNDRHEHLGGKREDV